MTIKANRIIKLTVRLCSVLSRALPAYSCSKSRHSYQQYQLAAIWCLMKYMRTDYRRIIELLELMPEVARVIGLDQSPHYTTVNKFFLRFNSSAIYTAFVQTTYLFSHEPTIAAIDSTGYSSTHASRYYVQRMHGELERRNYVKASLSVCTVSQSILAVKTRLGPRNDNIDFEWLARQSASLAKLSHIVADKGYDSEANHRLAVGLGSKPMIPVRRVGGYRVWTSYRKKMLKHFDEPVYHRRSLVETVNSVMKRLLGSWVQSRSLVPQCNEVVLMCAVYNVHRHITISFHGWFLQGLPYKPLKNVDACLPKLIFQ